MPELPEVETMVRLFRSRLEGRRIAAFASYWKKNVSPNAALVQNAVAGRTIQTLTRRAKFIVMRLDDGACLFVHLRMSGRFEWEADCETAPGHVRAAWEFSDGNRLLFCDPRKFGRILYTRDAGEIDRTLGPEPLARGFTPAVLEDILRSRARRLKPLLLDQSMLAGLGNIYTDESLFRAGLHPLTRADRLTKPQVRRLHQAIRAVLGEAVRRHGTSIDWMYPGGWMQHRLRVYGRTGAPCKTCRTPIVALRVGQRGTHICPKCQPFNGTRRARRS